MESLRKEEMNGVARMAMIWYSTNNSMLYNIAFDNFFFLIGRVKRNKESKSTQKRPT